MNYNNTYSDLSALIYKIYNHANLYLSPSEKNEFESINTHHNDSIRFIIGTLYFEIEFSHAIKNFRSNRYFLDALGIKILPMIEDIKLAEKQTINQTSIVQFLNKFISIIKSKYSTKLMNSEFNLSESQIKFLDDEGYLIVENVISLELCNQLEELTLQMAKLEINSAKGGYIYGSGNMQRIYNLIAKNEIFQNLITNSFCHEVMRYMFKRDNFHDKYYLTSFHANLLYKNAEPQIWHIDANVPDPIPPWIIRSNSNFIIHDYFKDNGATEIIPGSHKFLKKPKIDEIDANYFNTKFLEAPKGSIAFWHGHLWHRSGRNLTKKPRIALLGAYAASFFREVSMEENPYLSIAPSQYDSLSPEIKKLLGWNHGLKDYF